MSPLRYKTLLTYLPGMASVVNAFDSPHVQSAVYDILIEALDTKLETEGLGPRNLQDDRPLTHITAPGSNGELTHDLVEGDSIHADPRRLAKGTATVF